MADDCAIIVFAREPIAGQTKTRLASALGDERAAELSRSFLADTLNNAGRTGGAQLFVAWTPSLASAASLKELCPTAQSFVQEGSDLGERLLVAAAQVQEQGYRRIVVIGSDSPSLAPSRIAAAARLLNTADVVLGPTRDGGCYLIGGLGFTPELFADVKWSSADVYETLQHTAKARGLCVATLPPWYDVDTVNDLCFLQAHLRARQARNRPLPCPVTQQLVEPLDLPARSPRISVVIPVLNEEDSIGRVLADIPPEVTEVVVVDNGSTDQTVAIAQAGGARVVCEPERGYGVACLRGLASLDYPDIVVFLDGDYSDHPEELRLLVEPVIAGQADLVIGSRMLGNREKDALPPHSLFGNWLSGKLLQLFYGQRTSDLGPFRAIRADALLELGMADQAFGWTMEMQAKAARAGLRVSEVPVQYRKRIGKSKITGTLKGSFKAGCAIIGMALKTLLWQPDGG